MLSEKKKWGVQVRPPHCLWLKSLGIRTFHAFKIPQLYKQALTHGERL